MKKTVSARPAATPCATHRTFSRTRRLFCLGAACAGSLILPLAMSVRADDINGSGYNGLFSGGNWSDTRNWDSNAPSNGERNLYFGQAYLTAGSTGSVTSNNDLTNYSGYRINFENVAAPSFTLNGNAITLFDFGTGNDPGVINSSARLQTINLGITFSGGNGIALIQTNTTGGSLLFGGGITVNTGTQLRISGAAGTTTTFNGAVGGGGNIVVSQGTSALTVVYGATNTYSGETFIDSGTLQFGSSTSTAGTANNSTLRLGATSGSANATISLATLAGGQTIGSVINPRSGNTGTLTLNAANTSGTDTISNHIGMDRSFTITEAAGTGTLAITQAHPSSDTTSSLGTDIKGNVLTLTAGTGSTINLSGDVYNSTGSGSVTLNGAGNVTLAGSNAYTGTTTVGATSTLNINSATALGTSAVTLTGGASINNASGSAVTLSNNNVFTSGGAVNYGTSTGTTANNLDLGTGAFNYAANRTFTLNGAGALTAGTLTDTSTSARTITVTNGTGTASTSILTFRGFQLLGSAASSATPIIQTVTGTGAMVISGPITDGSTTAPGGISYTGTGSLTLSGAGNTYTGGLNASAGTGGKLNINGVTALGIGGTFTWSGGLIDNTSGSALTTTTSNPVLLSGDVGFGTSAGTTANSLTINSGTVTTTSGRTVTLNGGGALTFKGALAWTGTGNLNALTFNVGTGTTSNSATSFGGLTLGTSSTANSTFPFSGSAPVNITGAVTDLGTTDNFTYQGSSTFTITGNSSLSGVITLNGGSAALTLSGDNSSDTGGVTLSAGKLNLNSATALGTGPFNIGGGTLDNTSGNAKSLTTTNVTTLGANFSYGTSTGTASNNLNLGTGVVNMAIGRTITLNGAGALAFGGVLTNSATGSRTMTVNIGTGTTSTSLVSFGGYALASALSTVSDIIQGNGNITFTGAVTDGGTAGSNLAYSGTGVLTLAGNNTLTGLTSVSSGTLVLSGNNTSATGGVTVSGGLLAVNSLTALGTGTLSLSGGTIGNTSGSAKTVTTNNLVTLTGSFAYGVSGDTSANNLNLGAGPTNISGDRTVTLNGGGVLTLGALTNTANTIRTLTVNTGTGTVSTSALALNGYALTGTAGSSAKQNIINGSGNVNIVGAVTNGIGTAGSGLTYSGTGTLSMLTGGSTYTGNTVITLGTLAIGADSTPISGTVTSGPLGTGVFVLNGGTVTAVGGARTIANAVAPGNDAAGTIGGTQALTFNGNFNLNNATTGFGAHYTTLNVSNTGLTTFGGGINMNGQQLTLLGTGNVLVNSPITGNANFLTYGGSGTLTLSAANTYVVSGGNATNVTTGTLLVNNATGSGTGTGAVTVGTTGSPASTATLGGSGTISGAVTINTGSTLFPGATGGTSTAVLTTGALTLAGNYSIDLSGPAAGTSYDQVVATGGVSITSGTLLFNSVNTAALSVGETFYIMLNGSGAASNGIFTGYAQGSTVSDGFGDTYTISYTDNGDGGSLGNDISLTVLTAPGSAVPEPSTWFGGAFVLGAFGWFQRGNVRRWLGRRRQVA